MIVLKQCMCTKYYLFEKVLPYYAARFKTAEVLIHKLQSVLTD